MSRWAKEGVDHAKQAALAAEAKRRGIPEYQLEMARNVGTDAIRDLVSDFRRGPSQPSSIAAPSKPKVEPEKGTGWSEPLPLSNPPGVDLADRLMDQQDQIDRVRRKRMLKGLPPDAA
jgi:hypothetical protein